MKISFNSFQKQCLHPFQRGRHNKKIQLWALGMSGYNCKTEYIAGTENTCADLLRRKPNTECTDPILEPLELGPIQRALKFEVGMINSKEMNPKEFDNWKNC